MEEIIGIIDIGSNSMRLLLAELCDDKSFRILNELKEYVRLGHGLDENEILSKDKMNFALLTLKTYKKICSAFNVGKITVVATEAVRRAKNQKQFLDLIKAELQLDITVLSGEEEAYYDYFSTINSMDIGDGLIMDIGGASCELILVKNRKLVHCVSLPFGAITLTDHFKLTDCLDKNTEQELKQYISNYFDALDWLKDAKGMNLIGIGGSIRNLSKIHKKRLNYPLNLIHNYQISGDDVISIYDEIKSKNSIQRKKIKGLSSDRADIIVGSSAAISVLIEYCSINNVVISRNGIREGLLFSHICKNNKPLDSALDFSLYSILKNQNSNLSHAEHIHFLLSRLYKEFKNHINTCYKLDNIIKTSALLHDIGVNITYYFHNKHSFYMILNSQINGLTHRELVMSAFIAASHRDDNIENFNEYAEIISKEDMETIKKLGILLRIAENLDKSMTGLVKNLIVTLDETTAIIKTISEDTPTIEIKEAMAAASDFKKAFGMKLYIV